MSFMRFSSLASLVLLVLFVTPALSQDVAMPGDINGDGHTNHVDFFLYALTFDPHGHRSTHPAEDLNQDFEVDHKDLYLAILGRLHGERGLPPIDLEQTGTIEGTVLEDVGDALVVIPVPGANVFILASTGHRFRITADTQGTFRAEGIPAGAVSVRVEHPNYHPGYARAEVRVNEVTPITLLMMPRRDDLASLRGVVLGAANPFVDFQQPLVGAVVRVMPILDGQVIGDNNPDHFPGETDPHQVVFTNDQGYYEVHDLPAGNYRMVVASQGYESESREINIEGTENQVQDFLLFEVPNRVGSIHGTVTSLGAPTMDMKGIEPGTEYPLFGAQIYLQPTWGNETDPYDPAQPLSDQPLVLPNRFYETQTDDNGNYRLDGILAGKYRIHVWAEGHFPADATAIIEVGTEVQKNFQLTPIVIEYGAVAGSVYGVTPDSNAQTPLADALVSLVPRDFFVMPVGMNDPQSNRPAAFVQSTTTDDNGHYQFQRVPVGLYDLFAHAQGWGSTSAPAEVVKDETVTVDLDIVHTPPPGPSVLKGTVWLQPEGAIAVVLPASGADVIAIPADPGWFDWLPMGSPDGSYANRPIPVPFVTRTDSEGQYLFGQLRPGKYHVIASYPGYQSREEIVEIPEESEVTQDFLLDLIPTGPGKVLGRVTFSPPSMASEPQPIAGAKVLLIGQNDFPIPLPFPFPEMVDASGVSILPPDFVYETTTDEGGYFEFPAVHPGHYVAHVSADQFQSERQDIWVPAEETIVLHFDLIPNGGGGGEAILEGGVWEAQFIKSENNLPTPIVGATVVAIPLCFNGGPAAGTTGPDGEFCPPRIVQTDERGRYRFENLPTGPVAITVFAQGFLPAVQLVHLLAGQVTVVNFWLEASGGGSDPSGLYGTITQWTPFPTFAPVPVSGAHIVLEPLFPAPLPMIGTIPDVLEARSDDQGNYRFPHLPSGPYRMDVRAEGFTPVEDIEVYVLPTEKTRQDVLLYPVGQGSATYRGAVYRLEGDVPPDAKIALTPIPGATVRLVPDWMPVIEIYPPPNVGLDRMTNGQGEYQFEDLAAGGYGVTLIKEGYTIQSGHIQLGAGQVLEQDWFLNAEGDEFIRIRGRVQEDTGMLDIFIPIEGATVFLQHDDSNLPPVMAETQTGPNGGFEFPPVMRGVYRLGVEALGYQRYEGSYDFNNLPEPFASIQLQKVMEPEPLNAR